MLRVVYETRSLDDIHAKTIRCVEQVPKHELDIKSGKLRGTPVNIIQYSVCSTFKESTTPAIRSSPRRNFADLRHRLLRHYRRSSWKSLVEILVNDFIRDLEWEEVLKEAGYPTKPFSYHWHHFKLQYHVALRWSPNTRNMMKRLETMDWLQVYLEEDA